MGVPPHVFAKEQISVEGVAVPGGSHWLADDPLVVAHPDAFTADCRYGLMWSGLPPECVTPEYVAREQARPGAGRR